MKLLWVAVKRIAPLAVLLVALIILRTNVGQAAYIPTRSMAPTLRVHDVLIIDKTIRPEDLRRGDIVVFYPPPESRLHKILIKRLIGMPGDRLEVRKGVLYLNGAALEEKYIREPMRYPMKPLTVPPGKYFMLGDNRNISNDSHLWSNPFVDRRAIIGRAVYRIFPFDQMGSMRKFGRTRGHTGLGFPEA